MEIARLFYRLDLDTRDALKEVDGVQRRLGSLQDFLSKNKGLGLTALGAAAVTAGIQLAKMAEEFNESLRVIQQRIPGVTGDVDELRRETNKMALEFGRSQEDIRDALAATADAGVGSTAELLDTTRAALELSAALGRSDPNGLANALDAVGDVFGIVSGDLDVFSAALFDMTKGRADVRELLDTLALAGPALKDTGVSSLTAAQAFTTLSAELNVTGKKAVAEFTKIMKEGGIPAINELAARSPLAADAVLLFQDAVDEANKSMESSEERVKAQAKLIELELGSRLRGLATLAEKALFFALGGGWQEAGRRAEEAKKKMEDASGALDRLGTAGGAAATSIDPVVVVMKEAVAAAADLGTKSVADLKKYQKALEEAAKAGKLDEEGKKALAKITKELGDRQEKAADQAEEAAKKYEAAMTRVRKAAIAASITLQDDLIEAIDELGKELRVAGVGVDDITAALKPLRDELARVKIEEDLKLPEILEKAAKNLTELDIDKLTEARFRLAALLQTATEGSKEERRIRETIAAITRQIEGAQRSVTQRTAESVVKSREFQDQIAKTHEAVKGITPALEDIPEPIGEANKRLEKTAREIADIALGAIGVAEAFGVIDGNAAKVLGQIVAIGEALPRAFSGDPSALVNVIGSLAGVIGSLFGDSPEEAARKALVAKNTAALEELTSGVVELARIQNPATDVLAIQDALQEAFKRAAAAGLPGVPAALVTEELLKRGLTREDLNKLASSLGFDLGASGNALSGLTSLLKFLESGKFSLFGSDFDGQLARIRESLKAGVLGPDQEFGAIIKALGEKGAGPAILAALEGRDFTTDEGRNDALTALRDLFKEISTRQFSGDEFAAIAGNLNSEQLRDVLSQLIDILADPERVIAPIVGGTPDRPPIELSAETSDFYADSITAADSQVALLTDSLALEARQADALDAILAQLTSTSPVSAPALPASFAASAGSLSGGGASGASIAVDFSGLQVNVTTLPGTDAKETGRVIAEEIWRNVDRKLADQFTPQKLIRGIIT